MRNLLSLTAVLCLSACSFIFPVPHDPVEFSMLVNAKVDVDSLDCADKSTWDYVIDDVNRLSVYTELREDPQAENVSQLKEALIKAKDSKNETFCEGILKVQKTRIDTIVSAWGGR